MFEKFRDEDDYKEKNGYDIDGVWYPRVTRIVSVKAKPALLYFYAEADNYSAARKITEKSAEEGTLVHDTLEAMLTGKKPAIDPSIEPSIRAFEAFLEERRLQVSPDYIEHRIWHPKERYAGTLDAVAMIDGKMGILDFKTSTGIYRDYNLQTAAYIEALRPKLAGLQTRWILRIDQVQNCQYCGATLRSKGGRKKVRLPYPKIVPNCPKDEHIWGDMEGVVELEEFPNWKSDYEAFLAAKRLWEWQEEEWLNRIGYLT